MRKRLYAHAQVKDQVDSKTVSVMYFFTLRRPNELSKRRCCNVTILGGQMVTSFDLVLDSLLGHTPSTAGTFRKKFRKNSRKTPETLSERFLEFPSRVRLGCPKPYNSRHLRLPERFQNSLPSTAGDASFSRIGSGERLSELVMEFPAVLGVFLNCLPCLARTPPFCATNDCIVILEECNRQR